jgi:hypothetical protein
MCFAQGQRLRPVDGGAYTARQPGSPASVAVAATGLLSRCRQPQWLLLRPVLSVHATPAPTASA